MEQNSNLAVSPPELDRYFADQNGPKENENENEF